MERLAIVGAGPGAGTLVRSLRATGYEGRIELVGDEPRPPYERPPLSKGVLRREQAGGDARIEGCEGPDVHWHLATRVVGIDPVNGSLRLDDDCELEWDTAVLATGSYPRRLDVPGEELEGVHYLRTAADADAIAVSVCNSGSVAVIGGGFIGLEVAASAATMGCDVSVLEAAGNVLGRALPGALSADVAHLHTERGVHLLTSARITCLEGDHRVRAIRLADGASVSADTVVVGVGIQSATELADAAGLSVDDGILTDARGRTSAPGVYAIGDCARAYLPRYGRHVRLESHQNALSSASNLAAELLGRGSDHDPVPWLWSDQYEWTLQIAGFPAEADEFITRGSIEAGQVLYLGYRGARLVGAAAFGNTGAAARDLRIAQRLMESGRHPAREAVADEAISMKRIWKDAA